MIQLKLSYDPLIEAIARDCDRCHDLRASLNKIQHAGSSITIMYGLTVHLTDEALDVYYDHKARQMDRLNQWMPASRDPGAERGAC